ncbi:hypothetical protein C8J55DRAFT_493511 [Lentinula edodes]|uniref:Uncharacterized protein n=1 Tax=Lentinula lateritia TaxID=40482 RepID=A0A9W9DEB1_9AGAR|nr:hypothetical protein C8J55DRAFT_493511 [Lentinula edodes]
MRLFVAVVIYDSIQTRYAYPIRGIGIGIIASSEAGSVEPKERKKDREVDVDGSDGGDDSLNKVARGTKGISSLKFREQQDCIDKLSANTSYEEGGRLRQVEGVVTTPAKIISMGITKHRKDQQRISKDHKDSWDLWVVRSPERYKEEEKVEGTYSGGTGGEKKKGEERGGPPRWRTSELTARQ